MQLPSLHAADMMELNFSIEREYDRLIIELEKTEERELKPLSEYGFHKSDNKIFPGVMPGGWGDMLHSVEVIAYNPYFKAAGEIAEIAYDLQGWDLSNIPILRGIYRHMENTQGVRLFAMYISAFLWENKEFRHVSVVAESDLLQLHRKISKYDGMKTLAGYVAKLPDPSVVGVLSI